MGCEGLRERKDAGDCRERKGEQSLMLIQCSLNKERMAVLVVVATATIAVAPFRHHYRDASSSQRAKAVAEHP
jgi:hypothetical protein